MMQAALIDNLLHQRPLLWVQHLDAYQNAQGIQLEIVFEDGLFPKWKVAEPGQPPFAGVPCQHRQHPLRDLERACSADMQQQLTKLHDDLCACLLAQDAPNGRYMVMDHACVWLAQQERTYGLSDMLKDRLQSLQHTAALYFPADGELLASFETLDVFFFDLSSSAHERLRLHP